MYYSRPENLFPPLINHRNYHQRQDGGSDHAAHHGAGNALHNLRAMPWPILMDSRPSAVANTIMAMGRM